MYLPNLRYLQHLCNFRFCSRCSANLNSPLQVKKISCILNTIGFLGGTTRKFAVVSKHHFIHISGSTFVWIWAKKIIIDGNIWYQENSYCTEEVSSESNAIKAIFWYKCNHYISFELGISINWATKNHFGSNYFICNTYINQPLLYSAENWHQNQ